MSFLRSSLQIVFTKRVLFIAMGISLTYLMVTIFFFNHQLVKTTIMGDYSFFYKITVLFQLVFGYWNAFPLQQTLFTLSSALLIGLNLSLIIYSYKRLKIIGNTKFSFGGSSLLAVVATGCPGCGISILSVLGPATAPAAVFLHDLRIQLILLILLGLSIIYTLRKLEQGLACETR